MTEPAELLLYFIKVCISIVYIVVIGVSVGSLMMGVLILFQVLKEKFHGRRRRDGKSSFKENI